MYKYCSSLRYLLFTQVTTHICSSGNLLYPRFFLSVTYPTHIRLNNLPR